MDIIGVVVNLFGIVWTIIGIFSNRSVKKALLKEKNMIREKILDFRSRLDVYRRTLDEDKIIHKDKTLNTVHIRIQEIDAIVVDLERFSKSLIIP